jgi:hypothetical protein
MKEPGDAVALRRLDRRVSHRLLLHVPASPDATASEPGRRRFRKRETRSGRRLDATITQLVVSRRPPVWTVTSTGQRRYFHGDMKRTDVDDR